MNTWPVDVRLEWHVLASIHSGYLSIDAVDRSLFTDERKLTLARLRHGTVCEWELAAFDLLPAVADSEIAEHVEKLRELRESRKLAMGVMYADEGLRQNAMTGDEACEILAKALDEYRDRRNA